MAYQAKFQNKHKKRRMQLLPLLPLPLFLILAGYSAVQLMRPSQEQSALQSLSKSVRSAEMNLQKEKPSPIPLPSDPTTFPQASEQAQPLPQYTALFEENPHLFGWIRLPDTVLDYPVMYTPEEPEYYIHRDFDGQGSISGVPFLSDGCYPGCRNYILYGHNMENGSMFHELLSYADKSYWQAHPSLEFDTLTQEGTYQVFSAFYTEAYPADITNVFRVYDYTDLTKEAVYTDFVQQAVNASLYDTGIIPKYGAELLTLITCAYHTENGRFVVIGAKKQ